MSVCRFLWERKFWENTKEPNRWTVWQEYIQFCKNLLNSSPKWLVSCAFSPARMKVLVSHPCQAFAFSVFLDFGQSYRYVVVCHCWIQILRPQYWFPQRLLLVGFCSGKLWSCRSLQFGKQWSAPWPYFSYRSKKGCWFFSLFSILLLVRMEWWLSHFLLARHEPHF